MKKRWGRPGKAQEFGTQSVSTTEVVGTHLLEPSSLPPRVSRNLELRVVLGTRLCPTGCMHPKLCENDCV